MLRFDKEEKGFYSLTDNRLNILINESVLHENIIPKTLTSKWIGQQALPIKTPPLYLIHFFWIRN